MTGVDSLVISEVPISAHAVTLNHGTYCIFVTAVSPNIPSRSLPALKVTTAPGSASVAVGVLPGDGWLRCVGDAVLVRVVSREARVLLTSYDEMRVNGAKPPQIQVQRLGGIQVSHDAVAQQPTSEGNDFIVHIRRQGDRSAGFGAWAGQVGDDTWLEGVEISAPAGLDPADLEYQVVLGRGWLSPWVTAGEFCGSRGMGLPILGFRARLLGEASSRWTLRYSARCIDGQELPEGGPASHCEAAELIPLAALKVTLEDSLASAEVRRPPKMVGIAAALSSHDAAPDDGGQIPVSKSVSTKAKLTAKSK